MIAEESKPNMAGLTTATTQSQGTANNGMEVRTQSTFSRAGSISMEKAALRIDFESFGQVHVAYISGKGIRSITGPSQYPADVEEISEGIDGTIVIAQIGKAWRSRSGRALVIRMVQSDGDFMAPWSQFRKVIEGQAAKATISRFNPPDKPRPRPSVEPGNSISSGLVRGF